MRYGAALAICCLLAAGAAPAQAQNARGHVRAGDVQPLDRILDGIRNSRPGTFYDAQGPFEGADGRLHYRIKWMMPGGRIVWLDTDARSGRVLGVEPGGRRPVWDRGDERFAPPPGPQRRFERDRDPRGDDDRGPDGW